MRRRFRDLAGAAAKLFKQPWALVSALALVSAVLAVVAVFRAPAARARLLVDFVTGLAWPLVLAAVVVAFWPQVKVIADEIVRRVKGNAAFQVGGMFSVSPLPVEAEKIPSPPAEAPVGLENIALLHTSFLRPDKTTEFDDGLTYYQIEVIVMAPNDVLRRIEKVTYELQKEWEARRVRPVEDRSSRFKLKELANGTSIIRARVDIQGQDPLFLNRFIDLRPDGPRI